MRKMTVMMAAAPLDAGKATGKAIAKTVSESGDAALEMYDGLVADPDDEARATKEMIDKVIEQKMKVLIAKRMAERAQAQAQALASSLAESATTDASPDKGAGVLPDLSA